jgi:hypothetical protein
VRGNRVRWTPEDRLPMQTIEVARGTGALFVMLALFLVGITAAGLPELAARGETGGVALFCGLIVLFALGGLWGLHLLWYRKRVVIDDRSVRIEIRTLRGTAVRTTPLRQYGAIVQMDSQVRWWKYSILLLPDPDRRFSVCLAMTERDSPALPELQAHFEKLLGLRAESTVFSLR